MSDSYPEHLNPFAEDARSKRRVSIRDSFKDFRRSLRQSFRIKKKDNVEVTLRHKPDVPQPQRLPVLHLSEQGEALPRSRFRERLSKDARDRDDFVANPFVEEEHDDDDDDSRSTIVRRRGKKRAPLPPKSRSSQQINDENLDIPASASHWSLTSVETDYSSMAHDDGEDETHIRRESVAGEFVEFNKNMESLKDDTNNNVITKEESQEKDKESNSNNIPDLVVSCPSETNATLPADDTNEDALSLKFVHEDDHASNISKEDSTDLVVNDISNNLIVDDSNASSEIQVDNHSSKEGSFLYIEQKTLNISGSNDELNECSTYQGKVSLYITGSSDNIDASNNNETPQDDVNDENCNEDTTPTPKQRKHKLTKDTLLGV